MTWKRLYGRAIWVLIITCSAQDTRLSGPITGLVFDKPSQSLRQIVGMPGAAMLGQAILSDVDWASVAPNGRVALAMRQGEARLFSAATDHPTEVLVQGTVNPPIYSAWAVDSSAVALYSAASSSVQWVRLTPQGPVADPATAIAWDAETNVTAFAADEKSRLLILATAGSGVYRVGASGDLSILLPLPDVSVLALEPGGHTLWLSDRTNAQLLQISEPGSNADPQVIAVDPDRLGDLSAIALSSDRKQLYLANRSTNRLYTLERSSALLSEGLGLYATANMLMPLGRPSVFLLGQRAKVGESLYVLDESAGPSIFFVPAMEE